MRNLRRFLVLALSLSASLVSQLPSARAADPVSSSFDQVPPVANPVSVTSPPWQAEIPLDPGPDGVPISTHFIYFPAIEGLTATKEGDRGTTVKFSGPLELSATLEFRHKKVRVDIIDDVEQFEIQPSLILYVDWSAPNSLPMTVYQGESFRLPRKIHLGFFPKDIEPQLANLWGPQTAAKLMKDTSSQRLEYGVFKLKTYSTFVECDSRYYLAEVESFRPGTIKPEVPAYTGKGACGD